MTNSINAAQVAGEHLALILPGAYDCGNIATGSGEISS